MVVVVVGGGLGWRGWWWWLVGVGGVCRAIWRIYEMLLATTLEFTQPLGDRCSHSRCWFITRAHNKRRAADFMTLNHERRLPTNHDASG